MEMLCYEVILAKREMGSDGGLEKWGYRFWRGNDGDRGATVTMVGTNLDTLRYSGESDPRSLTLETTTAFVLHSRARHLLVHGSLFASERLFSFLTTFIFAFLHSFSSFSLHLEFHHLSLYLSLSSLVAI